MKYVDNLLECKPEEIIHYNDKPTDPKVVAIVHVPEADDYYDSVVIIWADGNINKYSTDGRWAAGDGLNFIYRPKKVKRLKPLHVILSEHTYYTTPHTVGGAVYLWQLLQYPGFST